ncbi:hypothetical protein [Nonomuraea basaltis]|uniref:hypothetical protein n=1 Tax=Nonomuraea basaltis TaxID=2495887 RepID=UPI00110C5676|nr:hypothetical protein [Nonomuraea basaltis]TMR96580.1 hypothetical protein EJK15_22740 [Nonomuraea basaltis]
MRRTLLTFVATAVLGSFIASPAVAAATPDWGGVIYSEEQAVAAATPDWGGLINSEEQAAANTDSVRFG